MISIKINNYNSKSYVDEHFDIDIKKSILWKLEVKKSHKQKLCIKVNWLKLI